MTFKDSRTYAFPKLRTGQLLTCLNGIANHFTLTPGFAGSTIHRRFSDGKKQTIDAEPQALDILCAATDFSSLHMHYREISITFFTHTGHATPAELEVAVDGAHSSGQLDELFAALEKSLGLTAAPSAEEQLVAIISDGTAGLKNLGESLRKVDASSLPAAVPTTIAKAPSLAAGGVKSVTRPLVDPSTLTLREILHALRPGHMVALVGTVVALLGTGYWFGCTVTQAKCDAVVAGMKH